MQERTRPGSGIYVVNYPKYGIMMNPWLTTSQSYKSYLTSSRELENNKARKTSNTSYSQTSHYNTTHFVPRLSTMKKARKFPTTIYVIAKSWSINNLPEI